MESEKYNLFLDDLRNPDVCSKYTNNPIYDKVRWEIVRNYDQFVTFVTANGLPEIVSFDHDLADEHYNEDMYNGSEVYNKHYETFIEKTGHDCVKWMVDYCLDNKKPFPIWYIHSMNPTGSENMKGLILNYLKHFEQN